MIHAFRFQNYYLALDVESGAVHSMDEQAYEVVRALEEGRPLESLPYPKEDVSEIVAELNSLHDAGAFEAEELVPPEGTGGQVIKAMCMHMAHDCNLRCKYCFADTGEFHGARMLMPEKVAYAALDFLIAHSGKRHNLEVDLFGGEPLMNWDVVKKTVAYGRELEKKHDKRINFTITTNCVALDDEKIDFINREMHNVVLSLDGRREIHDALRPTANGKGSFDLIAPRAQELVRRRGDKEHYVRGTFTNRNLDFTNDVRALREMGFEQISLEPVVLPDESPYAIRAEHVETVLAEYDKLASFLLSERKAGRWFNFFHFMVDLAGGPCLKKRVSGCGAGAEYVAVSPDGDIFPCHQFVGEEAYKLGDVWNGVTNTALREEFRACNAYSRPDCKDCWARLYCSGGCAANSYHATGSIGGVYEYGCRLFKKRMECAIMLQAASELGDDE